MTVLHRASWVVPVTSSPFENGGVVVDQGRIVEVGEIANLQSVYSQTIDHGQGILMPGLVNGHTHLELSHCVAAGHYDRPGEMVSWIADLLAFRDLYEGENAAVVATTCLAAMVKEGVDLIVDIGNDPSFSRNTGEAKVLFFHELLGLSQNVAEFMLQTMATGQSNYTCHAPYSTNKKLLLQVKKQNGVSSTLMPIHVAESSAEMEFIRTGQGDFRTFIEERGSWDGSFTAPGCTPVQYLHDLSILDQQTLCVHCVHVDEADLQLLVQARAKVCLCPGSNDYLGVGLPPVEAMLAAGLKPCLGTDSLASNPEVSIWREMNLLHGFYPDLSSADILQMATRNGALALDCPDYGTLEMDAVSMIFVEYGGATPLDYLSFDSAKKYVTRCM